MKKRTKSIITDLLILAGGALIVGALPRLLGIAPAPPEASAPANDQGEEEEF